MARKKPIRVLLAKPGLDGHDLGVKMVAMALKDAGMEVIYMGMRQTPDNIIKAALQEDADIIGLSNLSASLIMRWIFLWFMGERFSKMIDKGCWPWGSKKPSPLGP
jgi:hypothetical protein